MKTTSLLAACAALTLSFAVPSFAAEYSKGEILKVDEKAKKLTIKHGDLKNLDMPGMTMVFAVGDDSLLGKAKVGEKIEFVADRVKGKLTVVEIK
ncbi:hypothetical protein EON79_23420 [bacterium]|nr:MAG: hypothetical protein EON79_23420 [bacterium]